MITVFNRKELVVTFDMKEQALIRDVLAKNGVDYRIKTVNRVSPSAVPTGGRGRVGTVGQSQDTTLEYIIYVKKASLRRRCI
ncbi:MAG: hypothetical protein IJW37_03545 [Lachnospiraceae bacterium]|nr:hypothetical protein [Lachnospiraceae bacterium]